MKATNRVVGRIVKMRDAGAKYKDIAEKTGLSLDYCRVLYNRAKGIQPKMTFHCPYCGGEFDAHNPTK